MFAAYCVLLEVGAWMSCTAPHQSLDILHCAVSRAGVRGACNVTCAVCLTAVYLSLQAEFFQAPLPPQAAGADGGEAKESVNLKPCA